jgi:hypothetical protein
VRHPIDGNATCSFDIRDGAIHAIYVVRDADKLRWFLEHLHLTPDQDHASAPPVTRG